MPTILPLRECDTISTPYRRARTGECEPLHPPRPAGFAAIAISQSRPPSGPTEPSFTDEAALEHIDALYRTALRLTRNPADAEDLVQDTYLRAFRFRNQFVPGSNLRAWLFKILSNTAISRFRHTSHDRENTSLDDIEEAALYPQLADGAVRLQESAEEEALGGILDIDVRRALEELPDPFRLVVALSDVAGFSYREIADMLEVPLGTVMSRLFRGRRILRRALADYARQGTRAAEESTL